MYVSTYKLEDILTAVLQIYECEIYF